MTDEPRIVRTFPRLPTWSTQRAARRFAAGRRWRARRRSWRPARSCPACSASCATPCSWARCGINAFGANSYDVANRIPNALYAVLAAGVVNSVLVPQIVRAFRQARRQAHGRPHRHHRSRAVARRHDRVHRRRAHRGARLLVGDLDRGSARSRHRVRVPRHPATVLLRRVHDPWPGAQRARAVRPLHVGAGAQQRGRHRGPPRVPAHLRLIFGRRRRHLCVDGRAESRGWRCPRPSRWRRRPEFSCGRSCAAATGPSSCGAGPRESSPRCA